MKPIPAHVRFWAKVNKTDTCWLWTASASDIGYGKFYSDVRKEMVGAHRWAYEAVVGPIPYGLQIDHLCRNRACVNPDHLEAVTPAENTRRSPFLRHSWTQCMHGHEFTPENTRYRIRAPGRSPSRVCLKCDRFYAMRTRARLRAAA